MEHAPRTRCGRAGFARLRTEGHGVFEAVAEALEIGRRARLPVDILHLKIAEHKLWGRMPELVALIAQARANGQDVQANVYPYRAGQNNLASIIPPWAHEGGAEAMLRRLKAPALRRRLEDEINHGIPGSNWYNHYTATGGWEGMLLVSLSNPKYKQYEGRRMSDVVRALGRDPIDVLFELLDANGGSVPTVYFHHSEEDMRRALGQPFVSIGSDGSAVAIDGPLARGNPHPRYYGTFPRLLGRYVRDEKVLTLEEAVRIPVYRACLTRQRQKRPLRAPARASRPIQLSSVQRAVLLARERRSVSLLRPAAPQAGHSAPPASPQGPFQPLCQWRGTCQTPLAVLLRSTKSPLRTQTA